MILIHQDSLLYKKKFQEYKDKPVLEILIYYIEINMNLNFQSINTLPKYKYFIK